MSRKLAGLATILILLFSFGTVVAQSDSNTIVVGISSDIQNLDPHNFRHRYTETVLRNIYDGLVTRGPDMVPVPELAESMGSICTMDSASSGTGTMSGPRVTKPS